MVLEQLNKSPENPQRLDAGRGVAWITDALQIWSRKWLPWTVAALALIGYNIVINLVPFGGVINTLILPAIAAGFMLVCYRSETGDIDIAAVFAEGFRARFSQCLVVGAVSLGGSAAIILLLMLVFVIFLGGAGIILEMLSGDISGLSPQIGISMLLGVLVALLFFIPLAMALWFAPALIVLKDMEAIPALVASFHGCLRNLLPFLLYGLLGFALSLLATIPLGLGWLVLLPVGIISVYASFKEIYGPAAGDGAGQRKNPE